MPRDDLLHWDQIRLRTEHDFMKAEEIRELTLAAPTKPFTLQLADGRTIDVEARDHMAFPRAGSFSCMMPQESRTLWTPC